MTRRVFFAAVLALTLFLTGCQLAKEDPSPAVQDRLAGVLITDEYLDLFDFEGYLNDNAREMIGGNAVITTDSAEYSGRIWAKNIGKGDRAEFEFPGAEGMKLLAYEAVDEASGETYHSSTGDEGFADVKHHFISTDTEEAVEVEGTVYVAHSPVTRTFYLNPVYQTSDGRLYTVSGTGMASDCEGSGFSHQIEEKREVSENGVVSAERIRVKVNFEFIMPPETVAFIEMDAENRMMRRSEFAAGDVPDSFTSGADYVITEFTAPGGAVTRDIFDREDEYLHTFRKLENGICIMQGTEIIWE